MDGVMDNNLVCNHKKCKMILTSTAWVTSCSHIFCEEHSPAYETDKKCSLCPSDLNGKFDLIKNDLNPSEQTKAVVLAGLSPTNILEIGARAVDFWNFQMFQQRMYLSSTVKHLRSRLAQTECSYEETIDRLKDLIQQETQRCVGLEKELHTYMKIAKDLEEKVEVKTKELININVSYEALKKQMVHLHNANHMSPSRHSETGSFRKPVNQRKPQTKDQTSVRQATTSRNKVNLHNEPRKSQASSSQYNTPQKRTIHNMSQNNQHVFSYKHLPSATPSSTFHFNPVTDQYLTSSTPTRLSQSRQLFSQQ